MVLITSKTKMPCDAIIITGCAILNEAVLTGESIPVLKTPLPDNHE